MIFKKPRKFVTVGYGPGLFREILQDDARIISASKEGPIDALGSPPDHGRCDPDQCNSKNCAQSHPRIRIGLEESRESMREEHNGGSSQDEKQKDETPLHEHVPRAYSQQHWDFHHAVFHDRISKRQGVEEHHEDEYRIEPERRAVSRKVNRCAFDNDGQNAEGGAPENHTRFPGSFGSAESSRSISRQRDHPQCQECVTPRKVGDVGGALAYELHHRLGQASVDSHPGQYEESS
jgi:hypothetical protein